MENVDLESIDYMWNELFTWSKETLKKCGKPYGKLRDIADSRKLNTTNKPELTDFCCRSFQYNQFLMETVESYKNANTRLQTKLIESQEQVISVQTELSACKTEQLETLKKTVSSSVTDSVKAEFKSYSSILQSPQPAVPEISPEALKKVVKTVVAEEDRTRNFLIFGLPEEEGENLNSRVDEVLETVGQKPKVDVHRLGKKNTSGPARPIKVCVSSSLIVDQILGNARNLRHTAKFKTVFLGPDRSVEQRQARKELVQEMKAKALAEQDKKFYIRDGKIHYVNRTKIEE